MPPVEQISHGLAGALLEDLPDGRFQVAGGQD